MKKVLVITDIAATTEFAAGTVLKAVLERFPKDWEIDQLVVGNPALKYNLNELGRGKVSYIAKPNAQWQGARIRLLAGLFQQYVRFCEVPNIKNWIREKYAEKDYDWVLFAVQCQVVTEALQGLDFSDSKTSSFMWDDPNWFAREHLLSRSIARRFTDQWFRLQSTVDVLLVPSEAAKELFPTRKKDSTRVIYPFICDSIEKGENMVAGSIKIGFAGSQYAREEIRVLLSELQSMSITPQMPGFEFHVFSKVEPQPTTDQLRFRRWHVPEKTRDLLGDLDFAYLPYPFDEDMALVVKTSFPSKLSLYLAAGLPVIYHGPEDAAVWRFLVENKCGIRLDVENFEESLGFAYANSRHLRTNAAKTFQKYFSRNAFGANVRDIFDVREENVESLLEEVPRAPFNRVQTMAWSELIPGFGGFHHQPLGSRVIEYHNSISLSKYLYLLLRPEIIRSRINRRELTRLIGTFLTRAGIFAFSLISRFYEYRINSKLKSRPRL